MAPPSKAEKIITLPSNQTELQPLRDDEVKELDSDSITRIITQTIVGAFIDHDEGVKGLQKIEKGGDFEKLIDENRKKITEQTGNPCAQIVISQARIRKNIEKRKVEMEKYINSGNVIGKKITIAKELVGLLSKSLTKMNEYSEHGAELAEAVNQELKKGKIDLLRIREVLGNDKINPLLSSFTDGDISRISVSITVGICELLREEEIFELQTNQQKEGERKIETLFEEIKNFLGDELEAEIAVSGLIDDLCSIDTETEKLESFAQCFMPKDVKSKEKLSEYAINDISERTPTIQRRIYKKPALHSAFIQLRDKIQAYFESETCNAEEAISEMLKCKLFISNLVDLYINSESNIEIEIDLIKDRVDLIRVEVEEERIERERKKIEKERVKKEKEAEKRRASKKGDKKAKKESSQLKVDKEDKEDKVIQYQKMQSKKTPKDAIPRFKKEHERDLSKEIDKLKEQIFVNIQGKTNEHEKFETWLNEFSIQKLTTLALESPYFMAFLCHKVSGTGIELPDEIVQYATLQEIISYYQLNWEIEDIVEEMRKNYEEGNSGGLNPRVFIKGERDPEIMRMISKVIYWIIEGSFNLQDDKIFNIVKKPINNRDGSATGEERWYFEMKNPLIHQFNENE